MKKKYVYTFLVVFLLAVMVCTAHAEPLPENSVYAEDFVPRDLQVAGIFNNKSLELKLCGDTFTAELPDSNEGTFTIDAEVVFVYKAGDSYICVTESASLISGKNSELIVRKPHAVAVYATAGQLNNMYITFSTAISSVLLPRVSKMEANNASGTLSPLPFSPILFIP